MGKLLSIDLVRSSSLLIDRLPPLKSPLKFLAHCLPKITHAQVRQKNIRAYWNLNLTTVNDVYSILVTIGGPDDECESGEYVDTIYS